MPLSVEKKQLSESRSWMPKRNPTSHAVIQRETNTRDSDTNIKRKINQKAGLYRRLLASTKNREQMLMNGKGEKQEMKPHCSGQEKQG